MAKESGEVRRGFDKDLKPQSDEDCNAYYTRKQRTVDSVLAPDTEAKLVDSDDSFAEERNYGDRDAGPLNYKKWDRYGGK
jgi:hypothetical protein